MRPEKLLPATSAALARVLVDLFDIKEVRFGIDTLIVKKSNKSRKEVGKRFAKNTNFETNPLLFGSASNLSKRIAVQKEFASYENRIQLRNTTAHELTHALFIGKNNFLAANAVGSYFGNVSKPTKKLTPDLKLFKEIEAKCTNQAAQKRENEVLKESSKYKDPLGEMEHGSKTQFDSFSFWGDQLATVAISFEKEIGKPGAGLFLLKEVLNGKKILPSMKTIRRGNFDGRRLRLIKNHPLLRRTIENTGNLARQQNLIRQDKRLIARLSSVFKPIKPIPRPKRK
jgi:hypothetical protein